YGLYDPREVKRAVAHWQQHRIHEVHNKGWYSDPKTGQRSAGVVLGSKDYEPVPGTHEQYLALIGAETARIVSNSRKDERPVALYSHHTHFAAHALYLWARAASETPVADHRTPDVTSSTAGWATFLGVSEERLAEAIFQYHGSQDPAPFPVRRGFMQLH